MVFQTARPQPASNARATISPLLLMGQLASQNGLGLRIRHVGEQVRRRAPSRRLVDRDDPRTTETQCVHDRPCRELPGLDGVHHLGTAVDDVADGPDLRVRGPAGGRSAAAWPSRMETPSAASRPPVAAGPSWPTARTTMSSAISNRESSRGTGLRRPEASTSASSIWSHASPATCAAPRTSTGALSQRTTTPSERARSMACG